MLILMLRLGLDHYHATNLRIQLTENRVREDTLEFIVPRKVAGGGEGFEVAVLHGEGGG